MKFLLIVQDQRATAPNMGTSLEDIPEMRVPKPDPGRKCKLSVFPHSHFGPGIEEDLFLTRDDFPGLAAGDVVEVFNPDPEFDNYRPRLLLKVAFSLLCSKFQMIFRDQTVLKEDLLFT